MPEGVDSLVLLLNQDVEGAGEDGGFFALLRVCGFTVSREHKFSGFAFEFAVFQTQARAAINSLKFLTNAHLVATKV